MTMYLSGAGIPRRRIPRSTPSLEGKKRSTYCRAAILGKREQRWSTVFGSGWKNVIEPRELTHQEPVNPPTVVARHRVHEGASYSVEGISFN
jgi:hypothetical protein